MEFSVLMSIYIKSDAAQLRECFNSLLDQTVKASQYVLIEDGPVTDEVQNVVDEFAASVGELTVVSLSNNKGLGIALSEGVSRCRHELVARMDTDDIALPDRFEKQLARFEHDDELCVLGGNVVEFIDDVNVPTSARSVPLSHAEICAFMKKRNAFNHNTVMFRKSAVENAGGYVDSLYCEDYFLWVRMMAQGAKFENLNDTLVFMRIDKNTFKRRGGYKYYKAVKTVFRYMKSNKTIGAAAYLKANAVRFFTYVLCPNFLREKIYKKFLRNKLDKL